MIIQIAAVCVFLWIVFDNWYRQKVHESLEKIPEVKYRKYPLIGHALQFFGNNEDILATLQDIGRQATQNDGVVKFWFGRQLFLVVTDAEFLEYLLKTFLEKDNLMNFLRDVSGTGTIFAPVSLWRPRRKLIFPAFSTKILKNFTEVFAEKSEELVHELRKVSDGKPFYAWQYLANYTMDAVCQTNLGVNVSAQKNSDQPIIRALQTLFAELGAKVCKPWLQVSWLYKLLPRSERVFHSKDVIDDFLFKIIKYRREEIEKERMNSVEADRDYYGKSTKPQTFMNLLMELTDDASGCLSDQDLKDECLVIALAGTDTSAIAASFTLSMMARYPRVQDKVYQELREVLGDSKQRITNEDLQKLRYFDAVLKETLRLYPPVPVVVRKVDRPVTLKTGESLAPGIGILVNIWGAHRNPKYWGDDAEVFRPERFFEPLNHPVQFLPFSQGLRNCLGYQYAMLSIKTVLATVLREYKVLPHHELVSTAGGSSSEVEPKPMRLKFDIMMKDVDNFTIQLESRN